MTQAALIALPWLSRARAEEAAAPRARGAPGTGPAQVRQPWHCSCSQSCLQTGFQTKLTLVLFKNKKSLQYSQDFTFL